MLGCQKTQPSTQAPTTAAPSRVAAEELFVSGKGSGPTAALATASSIEALAGALLGDPAWLEVVPLEIHNATSDALIVEPQGQAFVATAGLSRTRAAEILAAFSMSTPQLESPEAWNDPLYAFWQAHISVHACQRREILFGVKCQPVQTKAVDDALVAFARGCALQPLYPYGIPDLGGRPARAPGIRVACNGSPSAGVPVRASGPGVGGLLADHGVTGPDGRFVFALSAAQTWPGALSISLDRRALLGPLADRLPDASVGIDVRPFDPHRWTAVVRPDTDPGLSRSLAAALVSRGFSKPVAVAESTTLRRFAQDPTRDRLSSLADRTAGHVDIVLLVEGRARFASRMSDTRVWYDAQGKLSAYNAWTGAVVATIETSVTASGVGDRRAEAAAREQLATALAELYLGKQALLAAAVPAVRHP